MLLTQFQEDWKPILVIASPPWAKQSPRSWAREIASPKEVRGLTMKGFLIPVIMRVR